MDPLSQVGTALPSLQSLSFHPILTMPEGPGRLSITPFVQRRKLRRSSAQALGLLWIPSSLKPGLTFPGPLSTGLGAAHAQPVLSLLCPSPLPGFHPSPLSHFAVSQQEGLQEIREKAPSTVPGTQQAPVQGGCLPGPSPGLLLRKRIM